MIILIHNSQDMPSELNKLGDYTHPIGEPFLTQCLVLSEFAVIYLINLKIIQNFILSLIYHRIHHKTYTEHRP